jgi:type I restriction enzyme, S subunit
LTSGEDGFPKGWVAASLGEVWQESRERLKPSDSPGSAYLGLEHVESGTSKILRWGDSTDVKSSVAVFAAGDILYGRLRPYLNKVVQSPFDGVASTEFLVFRETSALANPFLRHLLSSGVVVSHAHANSSGVSLPRVSAAKLGEYSFGLPPLPEQHRIVEKIEELFSELDAGVAALERAQAKLERYRASVLKAAVEGRWPGDSASAFAAENWVPLGRVVTGIAQGWSPKCERHPVDDTQTWGVIKTSAIQHGRFVPGENKALPAGLDPRPALELSAGDLLITRAGPRKRVGVACVVREVPPHLLLCDKVYRVRTDPSVARATWLELVLNSPGHLDRLNEIKTGISDSGLNLTQGRFKELRVPIPPLEVQLTVEQAVAEALSGMEDQVSVLEASVRRSAALRRSILKRAFEGQLVPQDPNDEPAAALLERIRTEREAEKPKKKRRTKTKANQESLDI